MVWVTKAGAHRFDVEAAVGVVFFFLFYGVNVYLHNAHRDARVSRAAAVLCHPNATPMPLNLSALSAFGCFMSACVV